MNPRIHNSSTCIDIFIFRATYYVVRNLVLFRMCGSDTLGGQYSTYCIVENFIRTYFPTGDSFRFS